MSAVEAQYNTLLQEGELLTMFPHFKGEWSKDKKLFTRYYEENEKLLNDNYLDIDNEEYSDSEDF